MAGVTAALLGDLDHRRELGKVSTQSDIHLQDFKHDGRDVTVLVPARYPEQPKSLSYCVAGADTAVLVVSKLDARTGEQILAADAAGIRHGAIVLTDYVQPEEVAPLLAGTTLADWRLFPEADWPAVRAHVASAPPRDAAGPPLVPVDHHFDVKGVGAVVLGVVRQGTLRKGDTLYAWPERILCPVRSIQVHDVDRSEAPAGDRVGLALRNVKADQLDRGQVLAPEGAPLRHEAAGEPVRLRVQRSRFAKQDVGPGGVVQLGVGMQFVPLRLVSALPGPGQEGEVEATLEKGLVWAPGERGVLWHVDSPQRVVGGASLPA